MAVNRTRRWLVAYDVRDKRRIKRVHRLLTRVAVPVQYSVFAAVGSAAVMSRLAEAIKQLIDEREDDVRMYPVPELPLVYSIGATMLPQDVMLLDARTDLEALLGRFDRGGCR